MEMAQQQAPPAAHEDVHGPPHGEPRVLFSCTRLGRGWFVKVYKEKRRKKVKEDIQEEDTQNKKRPRAPPSGTLPHDGMCARLGLST